LLLRFSFIFIIKINGVFLNKIKYFSKLLEIYIFTVLFCNFSYGLEPVTPDDVFTQSEIVKILGEENFFLFKQMDEETPIWKSSKRRYSSHFLSNRTMFLTMDDVVRSVLAEGFPLKYKLEELYREKLGLHINIGNVIPKLNFNFGEGAGLINIGQVFSGLFNFLLPSNWMKIVNQKRALKVSRYLVLRSVLDEVLAAKLAYINQHQLIQEFEILNYYFIHLQLLSKKFLDKNRAVNTLIGKFSVDGTDMASQRGNTKLGYDDLALLMALKNNGNDYTAGNINIEDIEDFPDRVKDTEELEDVFKSKDVFLQKVIESSVEMKIVEELYKMSKLNVGIVALGGSLSHSEFQGRMYHDAMFSFSFGYETIPKILISNSLKNRAKIDVEKEFLEMIHISRRSYDLYTNSLGGYTEAKRSLRLNRQAFIDNLKYLITSKLAPDALFIFSLNHLVKTELKLNNALHGSLKARAYMERFALWKESDFEKYLPSEENVHNAIRKSSYNLNSRLKNVTKSGKLKKILYKSHKKEPFIKENDIIKSVEENIDSLLFGYKEKKSKRFYNALKVFIDKNQIKIKSHQDNFLIESCL
jgi:hypothetical protein